MNLQFPVFLSQECPGIRNRQGTTLCFKNCSIAERFVISPWAGGNSQNTRALFSASRNRASWYVWGVVQDTEIPIRNTGIGVSC